MALGKINGKETRLSRYCRICATGFCFFCFGLGGLILSFTLVPLVYIIPGTLRKKRARSQRTIHYSFRLFVWIMETVGVLTTEVNGVSKLESDENFLILANHPSLIDVVVLISLLPNADCIIKKDLYKNRILKLVLRAAGYISNDNPEELIDICVDRIRNGNSLLMFPEGTRSHSGKLRKFQRGAATIAIKSDCRILPVTIACIPPTLMKGQRWYEVPPRRCKLILDVREPIDIKDIVSDCRNHRISARKLTAFLQDYFEKYVCYGRIEDRT